MSSASVNQMWQTIQQLNWSEQLQLMQLLLQTWQQRWTAISQPKVSPQVKALRGKYAFVPTSSEDFAKRKQQEIELER